jgi:RNA polymerase sigma factor (sigma-70 family)
LDAFQRETVALLPRLTRLARVLARDRADADDLVQITVERALQRRDQWRPDTSLPSWMFRIMKNAWIDEARARGRKGRLFSADEAGEHVADATVAPMEIRLEAAEAARAMAGLPDDQRLAVALVLVEGLSYREASEILEIPMGTLTSRLVRGRTALMARLEGKAA